MARILRILHLKILWRAAWRVRSEHNEAVGAMDKEYSRDPPSNGDGLERPNGPVRLLRAAPHNIEAEQALLGAIFIDNRAFYRVSHFLEANHFFDPLHQRIFETVSKVIGSGKQVTPVTLKTFFERAEPIHGRLTVPQYLDRLAADATTVINVRDYGRTIRNLATRRGLILIGEDLVNAAYDSPVDFPPSEQIEEAEMRLLALSETEINEQPTLTAHSAIMGAISEADATHRKGSGLNGLRQASPPLTRRLEGCQRAI